MTVRLILSLIVLSLNVCMLMLALVANCSWELQGGINVTSFKFPPKKICPESFYTEISSRVGKGHIIACSHTGNKTSCITFCTLQQHYVTLTTTHCFEKQNLMHIDPSHKKNN